MITLTDVRFRWSDADPETLDIPHFHVDRGERVFLGGPSGSGKTTLLNLLGGVSTPSAGNIKIAGTALEALPPGARDRFRADKVGFIFQLFNLVPYLGLIENVTLPCRFSRRRDANVSNNGGARKEAYRLLASMQLDVDALATRPVSQLSVGQQQRVAAARALIGAPPLIIADEPTSSLDHSASDAFLDLLFAEVERAGATLLIVSHDTALQTRFDRAVALPSINRAGGGAT